MKKFLTILFIFVISFVISSFIISNKANAQSFSIGFEETIGFLSYDSSADANGVPAASSYYPKFDLTAIFTSAEFCTFDIKFYYQIVDKFGVEAKNILKLTNFTLESRFDMELLLSKEVDVEGVPTIVKPYWNKLEFYTKPIAYFNIVKDVWKFTIDAKIKVLLPAGQSFNITFSEANIYNTFTFIPKILWLDLGFKYTSKTFEVPLKLCFEYSFSIMKIYAVFKPSLILTKTGYDGIGLWFDKDYTKIGLEIKPVSSLSFNVEVYFGMDTTLAAEKMINLGITLKGRLYISELFKKKEESGN